MIYKPYQVFLVQCRLISEQGFSLFLWWLPASPSKNTWEWECLVVATEQKEYCCHNSRTQIHLHCTVRTAHQRDALYLPSWLKRWWGWGREENSLPLRRRKVTRKNHHHGPCFNRYSKIWELTSVNPQLTTDNLMRSLKKYHLSLPKIIMQIKIAKHCDVDIWIQPPNLSSASLFACKWSQFFS